MLSPPLGLSLEGLLASTTPFLLTVIGYIIYRVVKLAVQFHLSPLWRMPGPPRANWWTGHFWEIIQRPFMEPHLEWIEKAGGFHKVDFIHYSCFFGQHSILVLDAKQIQQILVSDSKSPPRYPKNFKALQQVTPYGMVSLDGDDWNRHRRLIHPSFQVSFVTKMLEATVPPRIERFVNCWKQVSPDCEIDLCSHFSLITLDVVGEIAFHHDFQGMCALEEWLKDPTNDPQTPDKLAQSIQASVQATPRRVLLSLLQLHTTRLNAEFLRFKESSDTAIDEIVSRAMRLRQKHSREDRQNNDSSCSKKYAPKSILDSMLDAETSLTGEEIRDEIKTFIVAGHDTSAGLCYWATYVLTQYPDIQQRLYEELKSNPSETLTEIQRLPYLDAFLKEVLRMHSPVGLLVRYNSRDETFGDYQIPAMTRLVIPLHLMHHNPRYWKDPETFSPERWMQSEPPASHRHAYLPFSAGPRSCLGYRFAMMEVKWIMASVVREFQVALAPSLEGQKITLTTYMTVKAKPALKVVIKQRTKEQ